MSKHGFAGHESLNYSLIFHDIVEETIRPCRMYGGWTLDVPANIRMFGQTYLIIEPLDELQQMESGKKYQCQNVR